MSSDAQFPRKSRGDQCANLLRWGQEEKKGKEDAKAASKARPTSLRLWVSVSCCVFLLDLHCRNLLGRQMRKRRYSAAKRSIASIAKLWQSWVEKWHSFNRWGSSNRQSQTCYRWCQVKDCGSLRPQTLRLVDVMCSTCSKQWSRYVNVPRWKQKQQQMLASEWPGAFSELAIGLRNFKSWELFCRNCTVYCGFHTDLVGVYLLDQFAHISTVSWA